VALEAYRGYSRARRSDDPQDDSKVKQTPARRARVTHRQRLVTTGIRKQLIDDASGDSLDAAICAVQAAWGWQRRRRNFGLPDRIESCEGWIVSA
jgi:hypothetical protein